MADGRYLGWCFTLNNPTADDHNALQKLQDNEVYKYLVFGREVGEEGTPHLQGYIYLKLKKSLSGVKKLLSRAHWESQRGTFTKAIEYCKKDGDFFESGVAPMDQETKGKRGAQYWEEQLSLAKKGRISECDPQLQITHYRTLKAIAADHAVMPPPLADLEHEWYYGATGTGKSHKARTENPDAYLKMCNKWWDGYAGEDVVIIEDFDKNHAVLGHHLKIWADRYPFPAEVKGSKINIRPRKVIVTSNYSPQEVWPNEAQTLDPILRRFKIKHFH